MNVPTHDFAYQVLLLQAADEGRGDLLFGESFSRARKELLPFMVGGKFPDVYLEFPLAGDPFLDVTVLLKDVQPGTRIDSAAARGTEAMLDWYAREEPKADSISCGFELDTKHAELDRAAVHFQPRTQTQLVRPFFEVIGESERADLYLNLADRMPEGWPLSFFGLFRGRPGSPLRVCGYLSKAEQQRCAQDPRHLATVFDKVGFVAYDDVMLEQASTLLAAAPVCSDFQFDVYPDGSLGDTFAIDVQFGIEQPEAVLSSFTTGPSAQVMRLLEKWGVADQRWLDGIQATFARAIPVELDDGTLSRYSFTVMPHWVKVRWVNGRLVPAKLYHLAHAGILT